MTTVYLVHKVREAHLLADGRALRALREDRVLPATTVDLVLKVIKVYHNPEATRALRALREDRVLPVTTVYLVHKVIKALRVSTALRVLRVLREDKV